MGQDVWCSTSTPPLLRSLLVCQVACRIEWCIAAKTQKGIQPLEQHTSGEGSQVGMSLHGGSADEKVRPSQQTHRVKHRWIHIITTLMIYCMLGVLNDILMYILGRSEFNCESVLFTLRSGMNCVNAARPGTCHVFNNDYKNNYSNSI